MIKYVKIFIKDKNQHSEGICDGVENHNEIEDLVVLKNFVEVKKKPTKGDAILIKKFIKMIDYVTGKKNIVDVDKL